MSLEAALKPTRCVTGRALVLPAENVDTDQIIPARFLTTLGKAGLAQACFHDWRFDAAGRPRPDSPVPTAALAEPHVLIAGRNFGSGSSREHAPWALLDYGVVAVIAPEIADIFRGNALKNGLAAVVIEESAHARLLDSPGAQVDVDIAAEEVRLDGETVARFTLERFARHCLLEGVDPLGFLLTQEAQISAFEAARPAA